MEIGITGGVEDGVDNSGAAKVAPLAMRKGDVKVSKEKCKKPDFQHSIAK